MNTLYSLAVEIAALAERIGSALRWLSPAVARLTVGIVFFQSGWGKLHSLDDVASYFAELGIPQPAFQAVLASSTEFICGGLLLLGLATRFAAAPLIITMAVAIRTALWSQVDGLSSLVGLSEFAYIGLLLWLATDGGGPLSVDALIARLGGRREAPRSAAASSTSLWATR